MTDQHPPTDHLDTLVREMKSKTSGFRETLRATHRDAWTSKTVRSPTIFPSWRASIRTRSESRS